MLNLAAILAVGLSVALVSLSKLENCFMVIEHSAITLINTFVYAWCQKNYMVGIPVKNKKEYFELTIYIRYKRANA